MGTNPKEAVLRKVLEKVLLRRALIKEYEKATDALIAQLQEGMEKEGFLILEGTNGGGASFSASTFFRMPSSPQEVLKNFDARTMAAMLAGATVNKEKQVFLQRAWEGRDFGKVFSTDRSMKFVVNLPRSEEQLKMMSSAIKADEAEMDKKVEELLTAYQGAEKQAPLPDNPKVEQVLKEDAAKQAKKVNKKKK
jgi:hypothetical protein